MTQTIFIVLLTLLGIGTVLGALFSSFVAHRTRTAPAPGTEIGLLRVTAAVREDADEAMQRLRRELPLQEGNSGIDYGDLYLQPVRPDRTDVLSRSEIGRGFLGVLLAEPRGSFTAVTYAIVRLPGDETIHEKVLTLEHDLVTAVRRIDRDADIRVSSNGLLDHDGARAVRRQRPIGGATA